jgi:hypothetical protein
MLECFLHDNPKVIVDKDNNVVYLVTSLVKIGLDITDSEGKSLSLNQFLSVASDATEKAWIENEWMGVLSGMIQVATGIPSAAPFIYTFNIGFSLGMLFERLRVKKGLNFQLSMEHIKSNEIDDVVRRLKEEGEGVDDVDESAE